MVSVVVFILPTIILRLLLYLQKGSHEIFSMLNNLSAGSAHKVRQALITMKHRECSSKCSSLNKSLDHVVSSCWLVMGKNMSCITHNHLWRTKAKHEINNKTMGYRTPLKRHL